jgi:predicted transcriptional regulator of viral defense system
VNPAKLHITVPKDHRPQQRIPKGYVIHREDLDPAEVSAIAGVPVVKLARAIRQCADLHLGRGLIEQAVRHGRGRRLLTGEEQKRLARELELERLGGRA